MPFQNCNITHFEKQGYNKSTPGLKNRIKQRLCPTFNENCDRLFMRNDQPNVRERAFTAIKIRKCSAEFDKVICASNE